MEQFWWMVWEVSAALNASESLREWPDGLQGWIGPTVQGVQTFEGVAWAASAEEAWAKVVAFYRGNSSIPFQAALPVAMGISFTPVGANAGRYPGFDGNSLKAGS